MVRPIDVEPRREIARGGQGAGGQERIVQRVEQQRRDLDIGEDRTAARSRPVVIHVEIAVGGRGVRIVEFAQRPGRPDAVRIEPPGEAGALLQRFRAQGAQEIPGVEFHEAAFECRAGRVQVERGTY
ncbi:MAG: hypothetical protein ACK559_24345, partial [bacterium]